MDSPFRCRAAVAHARSVLVERLALDPANLSGDLARRSGTLRGAPIEVRVDAYRGERIAWARFASVHGEGIEVGSALVIPRPDLDLPILGVDLVALVPARGLLVADLSPTVPGRRADRSVMEVRRHPGEAALPSAGPLPAWCAPWFSSSAVFARLGPAHAEVARAVVQTRVETFVDLAVRAVPHADAAATASRTIAGYLAAHRTDDKSFGVLAHAFGTEWASRFVTEVLFPEVIA